MYSVMVWSMVDCRFPPARDADARDQNLGVESRWVRVETSHKVRVEKDRVRV